MANTKTMNSKLEGTRRKFWTKKSIQASIQGIDIKMEHWEP